MKRIVGVLILMTMTFGFTVISLNQGWLQQSNVIITIENLKAVALGVMAASLISYAFFLVLGGKKKKKDSSLSPGGK
jgi:hypothetical protein